MTALPAHEYAQFDAHPEAADPPSSALNRVRLRLNDPHRLDVLRRAGVMDSAVEESFDRLTRMATRALGAPVALVSLVDEHRQFFKSCVGLPQPWATHRETPLSHSFCQYVVSAAEPLVIEDAREHPVLRDNLAVPDLDVVAYAGFPITVGTGMVLGSFCVIDSVPRRWTEAELVLVRDLAAIASAEITLRLDAFGQARELAAAALEHEAERRRGGEQLRRLEQYFRALIENGHDIITVLGSDGAILYESPSVAGLGYAPDQLVGTSVFRLVHPDDDAGARELFAQALARPEQTMAAEVRLRHADGTWRVLDVRGRNLLHVPAISAIVISSRDVTKRKAAEEALRETERRLVQAQKMDALGRLSGGIAHDFNNLLTVIRGNAELLLMDLGADDPLRSDALEIRAAAERAAGLTRQLLAFSRDEKVQPREVDVAGLVVEMEAMFGRLIGEDIHRVVHAAPDSCRVMADPTQLEQVLLNLVVNARDAMPDGGTLSIRTDAVDLLPHQAARLAPRAAGGSYVRLTVADTGCGIPAEVQARMFEPFYTTKEAGKGTGLGLSTVHGIVQQSGGHLAVDSTVREGTAISVYLPRVTGATDDAQPDAPAAVALRTATILVVEDEPEVLALAGKALGRAGHCVVAAASGREAMEKLSLAGPAIDLVLTDVIMPGMSGAALAGQVAELHPDLPVMYMSGYTYDVLGPQGVAGGTRVLIHKPFTPADLVQEVEAVLRAAPAGTGADVRE